MPLHRRAPFLAGLFAAACVLSNAAHATDYPLTVTDMAGRTVTIAEEPQRIALQDGRDAAMMALLDRDAPLHRVVVWNNILRRGDPNGWKLFADKWPAANDIPDMGFGDNGQVDAEKLVANKPQLVVIQGRALGSIKEAGVDKRLAELNIPLLVVDSFNKPVPDAATSVDLLGKVLNREKEAADYSGFYLAHLKHIQDVTATVSPKARVFIEALAGRSGPEQCCFTHGKVGWGPLVEAAGAVNIGAELLPKASGEVTLETVLAQKPDVYVMTGSQSSRTGAALVPFGYGADPAKVSAALALLEKRPGFSALGAAQEGRVFGIWHGFYNHAYNIVGVEHLAKMAYPKQFADLDPDETFRTILAKFTTLAAAPFLHAEAAPKP